MLLVSTASAPLRKLTSLAQDSWANLAHLQNCPVPAGEGGRLCPGALGVPKPPPPALPLLGNGEDAGLGSAPLAGSNACRTFPRALQT